jgi:peptidoglycan hydrolase-like protein with peptidoglycan-binding domain/TPR repeat protein
VSRSQWAWTKGRAWVDAMLRVVHGLGADRVQARLRYGRGAHTSSSFTRFIWVATVVMLMLALSPALALGQVGSLHRRASVASATRGASQTHPATRTPHKSDPQQVRGASAQGRSSHTKVLAFGTGYGTAHGSHAVRALQRRLISLGFSPGRVDGRYGPLTQHAVIAFQAEHGLRVDGIAGPLTLVALASAKPILYPGAGYTRVGSPLVRNLQRELAAAGFAPGPIDGRYGPLTEHAVMRYQAARHLRVDGIAGPQTLGHLQATAPRAQPQTHRPASPPRATHHQRRPVLPLSTGAPRRTPKTAQSHRNGGSTGTVPTGWIIVLACVLAVLLAAALWREHSRRIVLEPWRRPKVPRFGRRVAPRRDVLDLTPERAKLQERATELLEGHPENSAEEPEAGAAAYRLGLLLLQDGNLVGAEDAFRRADERGHPDAAFELGVLLMREGDRAAAKQALRRADERGDSGASFDLGVLLAEEGDHAGAKEAFRRAEERGHPDAAFNLGALLVQDGDLSGAEDSFRRADQSGDAGAACNLGVLLEQRGDSAGAKEAYRRADERGNAVGAYNLGALLEEEADLSGAKEAYGRADRRGDAAAAYSLGRLLEREGDRDGAKDAYRRADQRGNPEAACNLGFLLKQEGDRDGALQAFKRAGEQGSHEVAEVARAELLELTGAGEGER